MTQVPASSHGGGLPSQWAVDSAGALTITLTGASGDHDYADALNVINSDATSVLTLDSSGELGLTTGDPGAGALTVFPDNLIAAGTHLFSISGVGAAPAQIDLEYNDRVSLAGYLRLTGTPLHTAPADADLNAGDLAFWFDQTNGAAKLMVKAKQANGTVVTASVALA